MRKSFKEIIKYGLVGVVGLGIDFGVFHILANILNVNYILSHVVSSVLAITNNFLLNSYFTFKTTDKMLKRAVSFFGIAGVGLLCSTLLLPVFVKVIILIFNNIESIELSRKLIQTIAKLGATGTVVFMQFFFNKYVTFKKGNSNTLS